MTVFIQNGSAPGMPSLIQIAQILEAAPDIQRKLAKYYFYALDSSQLEVKGSVCTLPNILQEIQSLLCSQESCKIKVGCTAVNWKHRGQSDCILRGCSLPVVPPRNPYQDWMCYYVIDPRTFTTTTAATTTSTTTTTTTTTTTASTTSTTTTTSPIIYG